MIGNLFPSATASKTQALPNFDSCQNPQSILVDPYLEGRGDVVGGSIMGIIKVTIGL